MRGDYPACRRYFEETLEVSRQLGDEWSIAMTLANLGMVTRGDEDVEAAWALHREGVSLSRRLGDRRGIGWHLGGMAGGQAVFLSDAVAGAPRFRLTYALQKDARSPGSSGSPRWGPPKRSSLTS